MTKYHRRMRFALENVAIPTVSGFSAFEHKDIIRPMLNIMRVHSKDVHIISWNEGKTYLVASGGDGGCFKNWDLRNFH